MAVTLKTGETIANEAARQIGAFQRGEIQPITTGIPHLDDALMGGLLPSTVLAIGGYSFHGKSYELEKAQRHIAETYPDVIMLNATWELEGFKVISRDLSFQMGKTVKEVLFTPPSDNEISTFKKVLDTYRRPGLFFQPEPVTSEQFEEDVMWLADQYPDNRIVVCIDNLENILVDKGGQKECMDRMLYRINVLKKRHKFISFIVLNQLNNDIIKRIDNLKGHAPVQSDFYGTGQLFKIADVVVIKVMPTRMGIQDKFMVFGTGMYPHLESYKLPSTGKTTSFDPFGKIFYFYLKARESHKDFQTVYGSQMYTREEMGLPPAASVDVPTFSGTKSVEKVPHIEPIVVPFQTESLLKARGDFENSNSEDPPF